MANYPQLDNASGVWNLREVYDAVMGGYWPNANSRALVMGGFTPGQLVESYNFQTKATPTIFGELTFSGQTYYAASLGSFTRALKAGGDNSPANTDVIDYGTFSTEGNFADFGNLTVARHYVSGASNAVRGVTGGGSNPSVSNVIDYVTIAATGNATDFGDLTQSRTRIGSTGSPTRAIFGGGITPSQVNTIDFVEISTTGNATDFGDLVRTGGQFNQGSVSSSTRGIFAGGFNPTLSDEIQFITMASQGNATDFGDLVGSDGLRLHAGASNSVKGVFFAGYNAAPGYIHYIQDFTIASGGTAVDVGSNTINNGAAVATSNTHGGLNDGYQGTRPLPYSQNGNRAVFGAGIDPGFEEQVSFINIASTGNDDLFGFWLDGAPGTGNYRYASAGGNSRGIGAGGKDDPGNSKSDSKYLVFSTKGNMASFGDLTVARHGMGATSNSIRSVFAGGGTPSRSNVIDYFTTSTLGNAIDFGDLNMGTSASLDMSGGDHNRGIFAGGNPASGTLTNAIDYISFSTLGNSTDFGDLTVGRSSGSSGQMCSATRSIFAGGLTPSGSDVIDYVTTVTTGNATDFGNMTAATDEAAAASSTTRGVMAGGSAPGVVNVIQFVTIASTGNASDFGDLGKARQQFSGMSDAHGGLQGG